MDKRRKVVTFSSPNGSVATHNGKKASAANRLEQTVSQTTELKSPSSRMQSKVCYSYLFTVLAITVNE